MASTSAALSDFDADNNQDPDDDNIRGVPEAPLLNPPTAPYPIQTQPYPYYSDAPPANPGYPPGAYLHPQGHYGMQSSHSNTTVIIQQPGLTPASPPRNWSSRLCECGKDWSICCCGLFCLQCLESQVARDMGESTCLPCVVPGWLITLRTKMRVQENINGSVMDDCCQVYCCYTCSLCQLAYEVKVVRQRMMQPSTITRPI